MDVKITQPHITNLSIRTHELEDVVKMLGFYYSLDASKNNHAKKMIKKGIGWVDRMNTGKLPRRDTWMSFFAKLLLGTNWGLVAVVLTPKALQKYYQDLYYKILPMLGAWVGISRVITKRYLGNH